MSFDVNTSLRKAARGAAGLAGSALGAASVLSAVLAVGSAAVLTFAPAVQAQTHAVQAAGVWIRGTVPGQDSTGAFLTLTAKDGAALVGVSTPAAGSAEIHEMKMEGSTMRMRAVKQVELPAGQAVEFKPGGYHIMLLDLKRELKAGEKIPLTLSFVQAGGKTVKEQVQAEVRALGK
ncbi:MAG: copper chaperone PCu(A)C [Candidatus Protistobacter heckmanni]|nr:copper chaperone PCu(A)C [Candidatus Protistobacter heckmanni]